ncbi:hypothetical protein DB346_16255 [Verrucomicrobia bacterium LW23]|nr:hypothetical protein DB346_16255 [Verrucomicrobia bacterium LW23]
MHEPEPTPLTPQRALEISSQWLRRHPIITALGVGAALVYLGVVLVLLVFPSSRGERDPLHAADAGDVAPTASGPQIDLAPEAQAAMEPEPPGPAPDPAEARAAGVHVLYLGGPGTQRDPLPEGMTRLRVWYGGLYINRATLERRLTEFALANRLGIEATYVPAAADYPTRLDAAMAAGPGHAPDVFLLEAAYVEAFAQRGRLASLPVPADPAEGNWLPWTLAPLTRGTAMLAYPCDFSALVLFYNRGLFDRAGQAPPDTHWDWQTWVSLCAVLQKRLGGTGQVVGVEFPMQTEFFSALAAQAEGPLYMGQQWLLGQSAGRTGQLRALGMLQVLVDERFAAIRSGSGHTPGTRFLAGQAATLVAGAEMLPALRNQRTIRWGISILPRFTNATTMLEVRGWSAWTRSTQPFQAVALAQWMSATPAGGERLSARTGIADERGEEARIFDAAAGMAQPPPAIREWPAYTRKMDAVLAALPSDGTWDEADALASLAKATGVEPPTRPQPPMQPAPGPSPFDTPPMDTTPAPAPMPRPRPGGTASGPSEAASAHR